VNKVLAGSLAANKVLAGSLAANKVLAGSLAAKQRLFEDHGDDDDDDGVYLILYPSVHDQYLLTRMEVRDDDDDGDGGV
jgi:hypothetical protein